MSFYPDLPAVFPIDGIDYDLAAVVAIDHTASMVDNLAEHAYRALAWRRLLAIKKQELRDSKSAYDALRADTYSRIWTEHEEAERNELRQCLREEEELDQFATARRIKQRLEAGVPKHIPRWRRNFHEDLIRALTTKDPEVADADATVRYNSYVVDVLEAVVASLTERGKTLISMAVRERDPH